MSYPTHQQIIRRRRFAGLVILALLVWGIWSAFSAVGSMFAGGSPTANPTSTETGAAAQSGEPCAPGAVQVKAVVGDGTSPVSAFSPGQDVYLWFSLTNIGSVSCTFDAGSAVQFYKITSGSETIWDSRQCDRSKDTNAQVTLEPGKTVDSDPSQWLKVHSTDNGCGAEENPVAAGGASYHLVAEVNKVISQDVQFMLN